MRGIIVLLAAAAPAGAQRPTAFDALVPELVAKIASTLPARTQVTVTAVTADDADDGPVIRAAVATQLTARGLRVVSGGASTTIAIGCGHNLVERVCVADIRGEGRDQIATVTRPLVGATGASPAFPSLALQLRPLVSEQLPILDAVVLGERLLVLDTLALNVFEQKDGVWRVVQSRPIQAPRSWPRDPRGRIHAQAGRFDISLPGVVCTGRIEPLDVTCSEAQQPWPVGLANAGLEPGRNYFRTPEGLAFYAAARVGINGAERWVIADSDGALQILNDARRPGGAIGPGDDVAALFTQCVTGTFAVSASHNGPDGADVLRLSQLLGDRLVQMPASPVVVPGSLTALWQGLDGHSATVVTHDVNAGRYDAFQASISCSR